jgi:aminoglycoside phosphotransferase (APT) family kinase protein
MKLEHVLAARPTKTIYRDGDLAIKLFREGYSAADVLNEALNHEIVYEAGVRVPRLDAVTKLDGRWAIVLAFVEGQTMTQHIEEAPDKAEAYLAQMVDIQLEIHRFTAERLRHHTDKMHAKIRKSGLDATTRYELHTRLDGLPRHSKLCHGDFTPGNVILTPSGDPYVIDWSHATQGNASADAARTYLRFKLAGSRYDAYAETYLDLFCRKSDTARQYVQKWLAIVAASQLVKGKPEERDFLLPWVSVVEYE